MRSRTASLALRACLVSASLVASTRLAGAQSAPSSPPPPATVARATAGHHDSWLRSVGRDVTHLASIESLWTASVGGAAALATHAWDPTFRAHLQGGSDWQDDAWAAGKYMGGTPEHLALSLGLIATGHLLDQPRSSHLGNDLLRAQVVTALLVQPTKLLVGRQRPDGDNRQSFPSGHAAVTFAAAGVATRHFGWRRGALAYAAASYVALSRVHDNRHYLSDVVAGATMGIMAGRAVVGRPDHRWSVLTSRIPGGGLGLVATASW